MADESPHRLPEHAQDAGELPGWSGRSPPFPSRLPPPPCFTATAFTPTSFLACSNSWYPPPKLSTLFPCRSLSRRFLRGFPPRPASQPQLSRQHRSSPAQTPGTLHQNCLHCSQHLRRRPAAYVVLPPH